MAFKCWEDIIVFATSINGYESENDLALANAWPFMAMEGDYGGMIFMFLGKHLKAQDEEELMSEILDVIKDINNRNLEKLFYG